MLGGVEVFKDMSEIAHLKRRLDSRYRLVDIIGKSLAMQKLFELLPLVARSDSTVLISGASGTGKELVARTIHSLGPRKKSPFIAINCAAIPETLLEAELFGHTRGAFTGARRDRPGRIAAAEGGTLLLDEIGDLPRAMQVKVLRFLQEREYEPLGSNRSVRADVRVIAATNRDLLGLVRQGEFREDLYFRLNVVQVDIPPLAERSEDIPLLVNHYVKFFRESTGKAIEGPSEAAMSCLMSYEFPGNVRELENVVEHAFVLCRGGLLQLSHLPAPLRGPAAAGALSELSGMTLSATEQWLIRDALSRHQGNRTAAAKQLGIDPSTLHRKIKSLGIKVPSPKARRE